MIGSEALQGCPPVTGGGDPEALGLERLERLEERLAKRGFIFDDKDRSGHHVRGYPAVLTRDCDRWTGPEVARFRGRFELPWVPWR